MSDFLEGVDPLESEIMANGCSIIPGIGKEGESCCDAHDKAYVKGEFGAKIAADFRLFWCIITCGNYIAAFLAPIILVLLLTIGWIWWAKYLFRRLFGWFPKKPD